MNEWIDPARGWWKSNVSNHAQAGVSCAPAFWASCLDLCFQPGDKWTIKARCHESICRETAFVVMPDEFAEPGVPFIFIESFTFQSPTAWHFRSNWSDSQLRPFYVCVFVILLHILCSKKEYLSFYKCLSAYSTILWFQLFPQETLFDSKWNT